MDKNKIDNLFEHAIKTNELLDFALGKGQYFVQDREYDEHSVINSWITFILPLFNTEELDFVNEAIIKMFKEIVENSELDLKTKSEILLYQLHVYYYLDSEKKLKALKLTELNTLINSVLTKYLDFLIENKDPKEKAFINGINLIKIRGGLS